MVVVSGIAQHDDSGLGPDLGPPPVPERLQGVSVIGVTIHPHHVCLSVDPVYCCTNVLYALKEPGDLVNAVDEHERPHLGELAGNCVHELQCEAGKGRHRARNVGHHKDFGLGRTGIAELGFGRDPAIGQRVPHGAAEVQRALAAVTSLAGQAHCQLAGQRVQGHTQARHLLACGMHEVHILRQWLAQGAGHGLNPAIGHQTPPDLGFDFLFQLVDARLKLIAFEPLLKRGQPIGRLLG